MRVETHRPRGSGIKKDARLQQSSSVSGLAALIAGWRPGWMFAVALVTSGGVILGSAPRCECRGGQSIGCDRHRQQQSQNRRESPHARIIRLAKSWKVLLAEKFSRSR